jgi:hypothetical protein
MTNIQQCRAKKIDSDEYVEGYLHQLPNVRNKEDGTKKIYFIRWYVGLDLLSREIDPSTLAIHFPDMLASDSDRLLPNGEKDLRIFASLSDDGKGGDVLDLSGHVWDNQNIKANCIALYYDNKFGFRITNGKDFSSGYAPSFMYNWCGDFTITGIKQ